MNSNNLILDEFFSSKYFLSSNIWMEHLPFINWLIKEISPDVFVELGNHFDNSYFSFCKFVKESGLLTKCYAVNLYESHEDNRDALFTFVNDFNQKQFSEFSHLIYTTSENAKAKFLDESIDLLHISSLHTYQSAKNIFETWLPKLSPNAVILFRNTNVDEKNNGIWKLWQEICACYPLNLEFKHSGGLGMIQLGNDLAKAKYQWLVSGTSEQQILQYYFSPLESHQINPKELLDLKKKNIERNEHILNIASVPTNLNEQIVQVNNLIAERDEQIINLNQMIFERDKQITIINNEMNSRWEWILRLDNELKAEHKKLNDVIQSHSWRITLPLREAKLWAAQPFKKSKQYILLLAKFFYQSLPLKIQTIEKHRSFFVKYAPNLILVTGTRLNGYDRHPIKIENLQDFNIPASPKGINFFKKDSEPINNAKTININVSDTPLVSVIIPIYGKIEFTLNCLASIASNPSEIPFEVIVVDDCSVDNSVEVLSYVKGIRLIQNKQNQGFISSSNIGANASKGDFLCFLNNDTQVTSAWLDELVRSFYEFPKTGLVGSKLVYPDGSLQEAGGIIWQDGSAWNFGRFQDSQMPIYNYAREVDYCSGASIMVPRLLFEELGGFDSHYLPAYCEDSDLALKIREKGYRVIYQPLSTVIHYEGITSGTDTTQNIKAYQVENTKKLYLRWKKRLSSYQACGEDVDGAKDRRAKHRILVLEHSTPTPNQDAGSVTVFNLLLLLREMDFQVTFIPEDNFLYLPEYTSALQRVGIEVLYAPYVKSLEQHLKECGDRYDLAFLFRPTVVERNIQLIRQYCPKAKVLYYTHDLHFLRMFREARLFQDAEKAKEAEEMKVLELNSINACDASILVSNEELESLPKEVARDKVYVFPLILNIYGTNKSFSDRKDIVFIGGFQHTPNIDAVQYFVSEIMPLLRQDLPEVCFYVVGSKPPENINSLASDDILITGFVENLTLLLDKMRVSIAPLRYGAGIKGKIGTAMAVGLPVVATTLAVEGMLLTDEDNIIVADSPEEFSKAIVRLYQDENLWNKISHKGLNFAEKNWGAESAWDMLAEIIQNLGITVNRNTTYKLSLYYEFEFSNIRNYLLSGKPYSPKL